MDPLLGTIQIFAFNFAPKGWAKCDGSLLPISQYMALFSLLGTYYGGDGQTTFGLPDLRSRVPVGLGQGRGMSNYELGEMDGAESITLIANQMPLQTQLNTTAVETQSSPKGIKNTLDAIPGEAKAHKNMQPYLVINYCIAIEGAFPPRDQ
jgi:microcystin-dependent protein